MSQLNCAQYVARRGGKLLAYVEARRAVIRLRDGRRVAITIEQDRAEIRRSYGFLDTFIDVKPIAVLDLEELHDAQEDTSAPLNPAILLDTLIERVSVCRSPDDVLIRVLSGTMDPVNH